MEKLVKQFIQTCLSKRKTLNKRIGSYGLKHDCEYWIEKNAQTHKYVSNEEIISAMKKEGFQSEYYDGINCFFNLRFNPVIEEMEIHEDLLNYRGIHYTRSNQFPNAQDIKKFDSWICKKILLGGRILNRGSTIIAIKSNPGQDCKNWKVILN